MRKTFYAAIAAAAALAFFGSSPSAKAGPMESIMGRDSTPVVVSGNGAYVNSVGGQGDLAIQGKLWFSNPDSDSSSDVMGRRPLHVHGNLDITAVEVAGMFVCHGHVHGECHTDEDADRAFCEIEFKEGSWLPPIWNPRCQGELDVKIQRVDEEEAKFILKEIEPREPIIVPTDGWQAPTVIRGSDLHGTIKVFEQLIIK